MARPVRLDGRSLLRALESSFENVPLFGRPTDEPLKFGRDGLSAPGHVLSQTTRTRSVDGRAEHGVMAAAGTAVARRREQGRPAAHGECRRTGRHRDYFTEELHLDPVALDVAVAQQPNDAAGAQRAEQHSAGVLVQWLDVESNG